ncbi:MAG: HesA/MoeB/ThiF family protein [Desulfurococcales archaeon]|nr:HesA/MoeB/ThiF family protein [Desulfurococcales archaeon]
MTRETHERYSRQIPLLGVEGQRRLLNSHVVVVGLGGLGSLVSTYLALAGVGKLTLIDGDRVEWSNLNRQLLYDEASIGLPKPVIAARRIRQYNTHTEVDYHITRITKNIDLEKTIGKPDLIIDALDNWISRKILGKYMCENNIPLVHAAVDGFYGQVILLDPNKGYCIDCIAPRTEHKRKTPIPNVGAGVGVIASLEALTAIEYLSGITDRTGILYVIDLKHRQITELKLKPCHKTL